MHNELLEKRELWCKINLAEVREVVMQVEDQELKLISHHLEEGQNPALVKKTYDKVKPILGKGEAIQGIYVQCKPLLPGGIVVTPYQLIFYKPGAFGAAHIENYWWGFLVKPQIKENIFSSTFSIQISERSGNPKTLGMDWLPKKQALKLLYWARAQCRFWEDEWRIWDLQDAKAKSGTFILPGTHPHSDNPLDRIPTPIEPHWREPIEGENKPSLLPANRHHKAQPSPLIFPYLLSGAQSTHPMSPSSISIRIHKIVHESFTSSPARPINAQSKKESFSISHRLKSVAQSNLMLTNTQKTKIQDDKSSKAERLKRLQKLFDSKLISEAELAAKREAILSEI